MTTTPHPAPAEKLTAEEEVEWRDHDAHTRTPFHRLNRMWLSLDASRAETEAVRRVLDAADVLERPTVAEQVGCLVAARDTLEGDANALRSLAAELVEGLDLWNAYGCQICHGDCASANPPVDGCPVKLTYELKRRARAQGIGGEKEKGNG